MANLGERVAAERERLELTQADLAYKVSKLGFQIGQSGIYQIEKRGDSKPRCINQLAQALGVSIDWLQTGKGEKTPGAKPPEGPPDLPGREEMPKDVPVFGTVQGGDGDGDFELNGEIVDRVRRPPRLQGRADVFALYVRGQSMVPWRESGGLVYVDGTREPKIFDYVVIELQPKRGETARPALVKRLMAVKGNRLRVQQYQPAKEFEIEQRQVLKIYRVLDWDELLGV